MSKYYLKARTRDKQGNKQARPNRAARGMQEVLNRRRTPLLQNNPNYTTLLALAVNGTSDTLRGTARFMKRRNGCPCCGKYTLKDDAARVRARSKIDAIKRKLGMAVTRA